MEILRVEKPDKGIWQGENEVRALDGVFSVEKGAFVAVIGPSGRQRPLFHILGGVDRLRAARHLWDGKDVYAQNEEQLAIFRRRQGGTDLSVLQSHSGAQCHGKYHAPVLMDGQKVNQNRLAELMTTLKLTGRENHLPNQPPAASSSGVHRSPDECAWWWCLPPMSPPKS